MTNKTTSLSIWAYFSCSDDGCP